MTTKYDYTRGCTATLLFPIAKLYSACHYNVMATTQHSPLKFKATISVLGLAISSYLLMYSLNVLVAHSYPPNEYGDFALTIRILAVIVPIILLGTHVSCKSFISQYHQAKKPDKILGFYQWAYQILFRTTMILTLISLCAYLILLYLHFRNLENLRNYHLFVYSIWLTPLYALSVLQSALLQSIKRYNIAKMARILFPLLMIFSTLILHYLLPNVMIYYLLICFIISYLIITLIQRSFIRNHFLTHSGITTVTPANFKDKPKWSNTSLQMMLSTLMLQGISSIYILMTELVSPNEADVGYISAIAIITGGLYVFSQTTCYLFAPIIKPLFIEKNYSMISHLIKRTLLINVIAGGILITLIIIFGKEFLSHFGPSYIQHYPALIVMSTAIYFCLIFNVFQDTLLYSGNQHICNRIFIWELISGVTLCILLIPHYSVLGAAIAMTFSLVTSLTISTIIAIIKIRQLHNERA